MASRHEELAQSLGVLGTNGAATLRREDEPLDPLLDEPLDPPEPVERVDPSAFRPASQLTRNGL